MDFDTATSVVRLTASGSRLAEAALEVLEGVDRLPSVIDSAPGRLRIDVMDDHLAGLSHHAGIVLDTTGSTFGYGQWIADVTAGLAPPSLLGEEMLPPPGVALTTVLIVDPSLVFPWSLLWHRTTPPDTIHQLTNAMSHDRSAAPTASADLWLPQADNLLLPSVKPRAGSAEPGSSRCLSRSTPVGCGCC